MLTLRFSGACEEFLQGISRSILMEWLLARLILVSAVYNLRANARHWHVTHMAVCSDVPSSPPSPCLIHSLSARWSSYSSHNCSSWVYGWQEGQGFHKHKHRIHLLSFRKGMPFVYIICQLTSSSLSRNIVVLKAWKTWGEGKEGGERKWHILREIYKLAEKSPWQRARFRVVS